MNHDHPLEQPLQPWFEHFRELKKRLLIVVCVFIVATFGSYFIAPTLFQWMISPLQEQLLHHPTNHEHHARRLIYTNLAEAFITYIRLAIYSGMTITIPVILWQLFAFMAPGLYRHEKRTLFPYLIGAPLLFILAIALVYFLILPMAWHFFLSFENTQPENGLPIFLEARVSEYLSLCLHIMFAFGLAFQMPLILLFAVHIHLLNTMQLRRWRRLSIVIIFAIAAIITPPDAISQIGLAVPMVLLYELSILLGTRIEKSRSTE
jgi:sec-independent protein translocase protein TatC